MFSLAKCREFKVMFSVEHIPLTYVPATVAQHVAHDRRWGGEGFDSQL